MARRPKPWYRKDRKVWCVTINGVRHVLGPKKKDAFDRFYELMREPRRQAVAAVDDLVAIIDAFLDWVSRNRSPATYEWYRVRLQAFSDAHPYLTARTIKPHHVERWAGDPRLSVTTKRNQMRSVKRCLKWAVTQGYLDANPIDGLEIPSGQSRDVYVSPDDFQRLLSFVPDKAFAELLTVTYETGCRPQESLRVEARHVDLTHSRWVFPATESKVKTQPRVVYLTPPALAITKRLVALYPQGPLFRNSAGKPWTKDSAGCAFDRLAIRMGKQVLSERGEVHDAKEVEAFAGTLPRTRTVRGQQVTKTRADLLMEARRKLLSRKARQVAPRYSLYALRHSWATNALQSGVDALTVAILMGHRDPSTLARTYQHLSHNPKHLLAQARRAVG